MSGLIKASTMPAKIRAFPSEAPRETVPDPELAAAHAALAQARAGQEALRTELNAVPKRLEEARRAGVAEGLKQAADARDRRDGQLARGLEAAQRDWRERLAEIDALAAQLARVALAKLLGDPANHADLVAGTIAAHCRDLDRRAIVTLNVSAADFVDLAELAAQAGIEPERVRADPGLASGACRVDLKLGGLDLDVDRQWRELDELLATFGVAGRSA